MASLLSHIEGLIEMTVITLCSVTMETLTHIVYMLSYTHSCACAHTHTHTHTHTLTHTHTPTVQRFMKEERLPHLLFYGPPGTGKTSTILACAKMLYKPREFASMVLELNASDDRGIGIVRGKILTFASTKTIFRSGFKLIILDEADAMTSDAQNALRRGRCTVRGLIRIYHFLSLSLSLSHTHTHTTHTYSLPLRHYL